MSLRAVSHDLMDVLQGLGGLAMSLLPLECLCGNLEAGLVHLCLRLQLFLKANRSYNINISYNIIIQYIVI